MIGDSGKSKNVRCEYGRHLWARGQVTVEITQWPPAEGGSPCIGPGSRRPFWSRVKPIELGPRRRSTEHGISRPAHISTRRTNGVGTWVKCLSGDQWGFDLTVPCFMETLGGGLPFPSQRSGPCAKRCSRVLACLKHASDVWNECMR